MVDTFFFDDSAQNNPDRGAGKLIGVGGIHVPAENLKSLESELDEICQHYGLPSDESGEFKWSPGKDLWIRENLEGEERKEFFFELLDEAENQNVSAMVVIEDTAYECATSKTENSEQDVIKLLIERAEKQLAKKGRYGLIVIDRPSGGRKDENEFLDECLDLLNKGTDFVLPEHIAINVLSTRSDLVRCLQLADLFVSCTMAYVSGEDTYSPPVFDKIQPMLVEEGGRIGGVGLKIHPSYIYANLYHWLLGDDFYFDLKKGKHDLPYSGYPYSNDCDKYHSDAE